MDTAQTPHTDQFTSLMIFSSDHDFPAFASEVRINYKSVIGYYKGIIEDSYVVSMHNTNAILARGMLKGQETVLLLTPQEALFSGHRAVYLVKVDKSGHTLSQSREFIGKWHKVPLVEALHGDVWTCYPDNNAWYVAKMMAPELLSDL